MVREIKSSPMLFGYRGAEIPDVAQIEWLISRVAQLQNDLPQVAALELSLVLAGPDQASVLLGGGARRSGDRSALGPLRAPAHPAAGRHVA